MKKPDSNQLDLLSWAPPATVELDFNEQQRQAIAVRDGLDPKCKHLSIWNKHICDNCGDCEDSGSEEAIARRRHPDTGRDGVTSDSFEYFKIALPGKIKAKIEITLSCGDSGSWYFGHSLHYREGGVGYSAWPKFSDKYLTRYSAFWAAAQDTLKWFKTNEVKPAELTTIRKMLIDTANYSGLMSEDPKALEG